MRGPQGPRFHWLNSYGMEQEKVKEVCYELCPNAISDDLTYYLSEGAVAVYGDGGLWATVDFSEAAS